MTSLPVAGLPVVRDGGSWHLRVGTGLVRLDDEALTRDLDQLSVLLAPAGPADSRERR